MTRRYHGTLRGLSGTAITREGTRSSGMLAALADFRDNSVSVTIRHEKGRDVVTVTHNGQEVYDADLSKPKTKGE
jgi:hypothetical protein